MRGNVLDVAVGIIIGAAFGRIVSSVLNDTAMPPLILAIPPVRPTSTVAESGHVCANPLASLGTVFGVANCRAARGSSPS